MIQRHRDLAGLQGPFPRLHDIGQWCMAMATFALVIAWLILGDRDYPEPIVVRVAVEFAALLVAGSSLAAMAGRGLPVSWVGPGLAWLVLLALGVAEAVSALSLTAAVEPLEALVILLAIAASLGGGRSRQLGVVADAAAASMLILFGAVHLLNASAVAELVPSWIPQRQLVPYLTGSFLVAAGLAFASSRVRPLAAKAVALMFLSWLPVVHLERLARDPDSLAEWRFALTALALAGALLIVGQGRHRLSRSFGDRPLADMKPGLFT